MEIPWDRVTVLVLALAIIVCSTFLAFYRIADWNDVYTIFLIVLAGVGFGTAGVFYGEAKAYREALELFSKREVKKNV